MTWKYLDLCVSFILVCERMSIDVIKMSGISCGLLPKVYDRMSIDGIKVSESQVSHSPGFMKG